MAEDAPLDRREATASLLLRLRAMDLPPALMRALEATPRQNFAPPMHVVHSYGTGALPLECGQTMPSADAIARVLAAADLAPGQRVLEIGVGSGYQTAVMARIVAKVIGLERYRTLAEKARGRCEALGLAAAVVRLADGRDGAPGEMFDRIIVNGALAEAPKRLLDQLAAAGVVVAPIGPTDGVQMMTRLEKVGVRFEARPLFPVRMQALEPGVALAI